MTSTEKLRKDILKYVDTADDETLLRMQMLIEDTDHVNWWEDPSVVREMDERYEALVSGKDPGLSFDEIKATIAKLNDPKQS